MYKNDITNVLCVNDKVTFSYHGGYQSAANLRNFMKNNIYSYLIDKVTIHQNNSHMSNEHLAAKRFALLVLNNDNVNDHTVGYLHVVGPKMVMASDIQGLSFVHDARIVYLRPGEVLKCDFTVAYDCGQNHQKWNPAAAVTFCDNIDNNNKEENYKFSFELVGMLSIDEIMEQIP